MGEQTLEFRVIQGMQSGASMVVGSRMYVVGSSRDCDIVLSGSMITPEHMKMTVTEDGFTVEPMGSSVIFVLGEGRADEPKLLPLGKLIRLGSACVTVSHVLAHWPTQEDVHLQEKGIMPVKAFEQEAQLTVRERMPLALEASDFFSQRKVFSIFLLITLFLSVSYPSYHLLRNRISPSPLPVAKKVLTDGEVKEAVARALQSAGARTETGFEKHGGRYHIVAYVPDRARYDVFAENLKAIDAPISARVYVDKSIRDLLSLRVSKISKKLSATYLGLGRGRVSGIAIPKAEQAKIAEIKSVIPGLREIEIRSIPLQNFIAQLVASLGYDGLARDISFVPDGSRIVANGQIDTRRAPQWKAVLEGFRKLNGENPQVVDRVVLVTDLPFEVRAVIGGSTPFVVTAGGKKIMLGATFEGAKLVSVDDRKGAVFEKDGVLIAVS